MKIYRLNEWDNKNLRCTDSGVYYDSIEKVITYLDKKGDWDLTSNTSKEDRVELLKNTLTDNYIITIEVPVKEGSLAELFKGVYPDKYYYAVTQIDVL